MTVFDDMFLPMKYETVQVMLRLCRLIITYVSYNFIFAEVSNFFSVEITRMYDNLFITFLVPIHFIFV